MYNPVQTGQLSNHKRVGYARKYFKKRLKAISEIVHLEPENVTQESIHELRLEIKKIKALFRLICHSNCNFRVNKYFRPFKLVFERAGEVRMIQVEQELLKKYIPDSSDSYLGQLKKLNQEKNRAMAKTIKSDKIAKLKRDKKEIIPFLNRVSEKDVKHFLKKDARQLAKLIEAKIFKEQNLHGIRKELKSFYFIAKTTFTEMTIPEPWIKLQELLGEWHDAQVAIEHVRKAIYFSRFNQDEISRLYKVKHELTENRENLFDQIIGIYSLIKIKEGAVAVPDALKVMKPCKCLPV